VEPVTSTVDGIALYGEYHAPPKPRKALGGVLLVHGFNSAIQEYGSFPERLAARGFHVLAFDQRGFGASGGERGRIGLDRFVADCDAAVALLRERTGKKAPLAIVGHSLGGAYALGYMARRSIFEAAIIAHPVQRLFDEAWLVEKPVFMALGRINRRRLRNGKASLRVPYRVGYKTIFEDRKRAKAAKATGSYLSRTMNMANYDFARTMDACDWARHVVVPVLAVRSDRDRVVDLDHTRGVFAALAGPVEELVHEGGHSCFRDLDEDKVFEGCAAWLETRLGA
jgi:alpha-beta hydrolase superfamily lysophospholipase